MPRCQTSFGAGVFSQPMQFLLDTHSFLWLDNAPARLSERVALLIQDPRNTLYLSLASLWEMQIKLSTGKLQLRLPLSQVVTEQQQINHIQLLSLQPAHIYALAQLHTHHKDPFDRLLIAQALHENLPLVSVDSVFAAYPVQVIW